MRGSGFRGAVVRWESGAVVVTSAATTIWIGITKDYWPAKAGGFGPSQMLEATLPVPKLT